MSDSEEEISERQYKIVLVGDQQVGKTAIAHRSLEIRTFYQNYI